MRNLVMLVTAVVMVGGVLSGCSRTPPSGDIYRSGEALTPQKVRFGEVVSVRTVQVDTGGSGATGAMAGGAIGGVAGSRMGSGRGSDAVLGGLIGATVGAIAGAAAEGASNKHDALELTVKMQDTGDMMSIVQAGQETFTAGQKVRVLIQNGVYRVSPF